MSSSSHKFALQEKHRVGAQSAGDDFSMAVQNGFAAEGSGIKKRPAAALAIEDGEVEEADDISEDSSKSRRNRRRRRLRWS